MRAFTNLGINLDTTPQAGVYEGHVEPTGAGLMDIMQEASAEFDKFNSALYVMDVVHEQATLESAQEAEAVFESVVKDSLTKIKEFFVNLWNKITAWFKAVFIKLKNMFLSGKKFIDANKKLLNEKNVLGFKYKGRKITVEEGGTKVEEISNKIDQLIEDEKRINDPISKTEETSEEARERLLKAVGFDEVSEISKEIRLAFFNGEEPDEADEIEDFSANDKRELIELVSNSGKAIKAVEKEKVKIDKALRDIIKEIDSTIKKVNSGSSDDKQKAVIISNLTRSSNNIKYLFSLGTTVVSAAVEGIKAASKDAERILKKYISYKPAKESFESGFEGGQVVNESLLDRAMKLI